CHPTPPTAGVHVLLRREGWRVNHKLGYRLDREERRALKRRRPKRRKSAAPREVRPLVSRANERWAMDFVHDVLADGRTIRILAVVDVFSRECVALVYSTRFPWTPLWGRRGGPEEIGGMLTERQLNGSGELPERWSAKRKTEIVLRLLRGEDLGQISREIQVAPQVIEEWRRAFLAGAEA